MVLVLNEIPVLKRNKNSPQKKPGTTNLSRSYNKQFHKLFANKPVRVSRRDSQMYIYDLWKLKDAKNRLLQM
jgi:hypothetical protein